MTVIRPNSVSGINSITAQSDEIKVFKSDGTQGGLIIGGANLNATSGISTILALNVTGNVSIAGTLTYQDVTNVDSVGIITARSTIDAQGVINLADSIIHTGDTNTKIRFPTADTFTVETAGNERFRIGSNGKIGIGTDNPTSILDARGNVQFGDGGGFDMNVLGTRHQFSINGSEKLRIASNGNIFVNNGNASANATLILSKSASGFAKLEFDEVTSQKAYIELDASEDLVHYGAAGVNQTFYAGGSERVRITSDGYVHLGNTGHGTNKVGGQAVTGEDFDPYFKMYASTSNHWLMQLRSDTGTGSNGIFMRAGTNSNDYTAYLTGRDEHVKHFIVRGDGNIGIGTDAPGRLLTVEKSSTGSYSTTAFNGASNTSLRIYNPSGTDNSGVGYYTGLEFVTGRGASSYGQVGLERTGNNIGDIFFKFRTGASSYAERLRIKSTGIVTKPEHPAFFVTMNGGDQTTAAANILPFDTVVHNNGGHFKTSGADIYNFVCPVDGYYFFGGQVWLKHGSGTGNHARWEIWRDSTIVALAGWHQNGVNLGDMQSAATVTIYCDAGAKVYMEADYALTYWRGNAGNPHTFFHGHLIG